MVNKPAANALGGRGLGIVDQLSLRWGVTPRNETGETTVWAVLTLSGDAEQEPENMTAIGPQGHNRTGHNASVHNGTGPGLVIASSRDA
jgi:hypothetical protein